MMTKKRTPRVLGIKFVWALPALVLLLFAFAEPRYQATSEKNETTVSNSVSQEKNQIKGKVVNENGEPIHGVSIVIKGTTNGTVSNENGEFELSASENQQVVFSYVGKETVEVEVSSFNPAGKQEITLNEGVFQIIPEKHFGDEMPPPPPPPLPSKDNDEEVFFVVEDIPQYPDGFYALGQYVEEMQEKVAKSDNISGNAVVGFTVSETGKVTNIKIVEQDNEEVGKAAATIAKNMKDWTPGKQRGKPVPVKMTLPVEF